MCRRQELMTIVRAAGRSLVADLGPGEWQVRRRRGLRSIPTGAACNAAKPRRPPGGPAARSPSFHKAPTSRGTTVRPLLRPSSATSGTQPRPCTRNPAADCLRPVARRASTSSSARSLRACGSTARISPQRRREAQQVVVLAKRTLGRPANAAHSGHRGALLLVGPRGPHARDHRLLTRPEASVVRARLREAQRAVRTPAYDVGISVVLPVVLPEAHGADLEPAALAESPFAAAGAAQRHGTKRRKPSDCISQRAFVATPTGLEASATREAA